MTIFKINNPMEAFHTIDKQTEMEIGEISFKTYKSTFRIKRREIMGFLDFLSHNNIFDIKVDTITEGETVLITIPGEKMKEIRVLSTRG